MISFLRSAPKLILKTDKVDRGDKIVHKFLNMGGHDNILSTSVCFKFSMITKKKSYFSFSGLLEG